MAATNMQLGAEDAWSFAIATPDALVMHRLEDIFGILRTHGFRVGACRLLELDWGRMGQMYTHSDNPPPSPVEEKRGFLPGVVMKKIYGLCPAVVLGEHQVFNLLHCPDDAPSAAIELSYLVGRPDAEALVSLALAGDERLAALYDVSDSSTVLPMPELPAAEIYLSPLEAVALDAHRRS